MSAADVLGILSFSLHAIHKLYDAVQEIRNAPKEMEALLVEISRVRGLLMGAIETPMLTDDPGRNETLQNVLRLCPDLIEQARKLTEAASYLVEKSTKITNDGSRKVVKRKWPFYSSEAAKLAKDIRAWYLAVSAVYSIAMS